jgi:MoaA/NifB/PqqE/SkfB family radical SAM enzyme
MELTGLHLLLTYQCTLECDHCFTWGSPWQRGTMSSADIEDILRQADELGTVEWIYFEGGEPFLFHPVLVNGVGQAAARGYRVGVVSNAYWATDAEDAEEWLLPLAGLLDDLSVSDDFFHGGPATPSEVWNARAAAEALGIPVATISIARPATAAPPVVGQLPAGESGVMLRGRAAETLADQIPLRPWQSFRECPYEDLRDPGRVHVDPFGWVHVCQGITLGNVFETPLRQICEGYDPDAHPVTGPLLAGGPAELARRRGFEPADGYADACHLCYRTREALRTDFPGDLGPDAMYGVPTGATT